MVRTVLHFDLDAFFCSVEVLMNPDLEGVPFVVGGKAETRGVVSSASYPARKFRVRSAMPTAQAVRLCPNLVVVSPDHRNYQRYSQKVMDLVRKSSPFFQQVSIDEAFLDVSDAPETGEQIARRLQKEIEERFHLPTSWGVASNKLVAKIATEVGKPKGCLVVPPGQEAEFLAPLPVDMLWGVGPKTRDRLADLAVTTIGDLAALSRQQLRSKFGERGLDLAARAVGRDDRPVEEEHRRRSISTERTFAQDVSSEETLLRTLRRMSEELGNRLRKKELAGWVVRVKIRWPSFQTLTRQVKLNNPTDLDTEIYQAACELFYGVWKRGKKVRLLGIGVADLGPQVRQLELFDRSWETDHKLLEAIDEIRKKYGRHAVRRAETLRRKKD
jgi:DNA polymerase-4